MTDEPLLIELQDGTAFAAPGRQDLTRALDLLTSPGNQYLILSRPESGPEVFIQVFRHAAEDWQVEYREGAGDRHYQAVDNQPRARAEDLLAGWLSATPGWQDAVAWQLLDLAEPQAPPRLVTMVHEPDPWRRLANIGTHRAGQFYADIMPAPGRGSRELIALLHLFDPRGRHLESRLRPATGLDEAESLLQDLLGELDEVAYGDLRIHPFSVDVDGEAWGLLDTSHGPDDERYELMPQQMMFYAPWDGRYDT